VPLAPALKLEPWGETPLRAAGLLALKAAPESCTRDGLAELELLTAEVLPAGASVPR